MAGYTRQSTFGDGDVVDPDELNNEFDEIETAFGNTTGHTHDGSANSGPVIGLIGDAGETSPNNKIEVDTSNNRLRFFIEVAAAPVEQIRIEDGVIIPVTDSDITLGNNSTRFAGGFVDTWTSGTLVLTGGSITDTSGSISFGNENLSTTGTLASGNLTVSSDIVIASGSITSVSGDIDFGNETLQTTGAITFSGGGSLTGTWSDLGTITTVDINGGTVDGVVIGGSSPAAGTFTSVVVGDLTIGDGTITDSSGAISFGDDNLSGTGTLSFSSGGSLTGTWSDLGTVTTVDINGGTLDGVIIGGTTPAAATVTSLNATGGGSLTGTWSDLGTVTTIDINGGTIDGVVIGGSTAAAGSFTTIDTTGDVTVGTGSGLTPSSYANELFIQSSGNTGITIGSGTSSEGSIYFGDSGDNASGFVSYSHSSNSLSIGTGGGDTAVTFDSDQNAAFEGHIEQSAEDGITATGTTQGAATLLTKDFNVVDAVSSGQGVKLPPAKLGREVTVYSSITGPVEVWPNTGDEIDNYGTNNKDGQFLERRYFHNYRAVSDTQWVNHRYATY